MKNQLLIFTILSFFGIEHSFAQRTDTTYYPSKGIKEIKVYQNNQVMVATSFKKNGDIAYKWDLNKKTIESFDAISYQDTLVQYFKTNCSEYALIQHYGNGPLFRIEHYRNGVRHGDFEKYSPEGKLLILGQYDTWKKVGIWTYYNSEGNPDRHIHWFHHHANSKGISIDYTIIPVLILLLITWLICYLITSISSFAWFYYWYTLFCYFILAILFMLSKLVEPFTLFEMTASFKPYIEPIIKSIFVILIGLSLGSSILKKKSNVKLYLSIPILLISIVIELWLIIAFELAGIRVV